MNTETPMSPAELAAAFEDAAICLENCGEKYEAADLRTAVAALIQRVSDTEQQLQAAIEREAALIAERDALAEWQSLARPLLAAGASWMPVRKCAMGIREIEALCHRADDMRKARAEARNV